MKIRYSGRTIEAEAGMTVMQCLLLSGEPVEGALAAQIGRNYAVKVATSDALVQLSSLRSGVLRMSARELQEELSRTNDEMKAHFEK